MTKQESGIPVNYLGFPRKLQRTHGAVGQTNGFSKDADHRPHSLDNTMDGTGNMKTEG